MLTNVFDSDAFGMVPLTLALQDVPFVPGRIGQLGLFESRGISTLDMAIERQGANFNLIPVTPRGSPPSQYVPSKRDILRISTVRLSEAAALNADEIQGVRAFGSEDMFMTLQTLIQQKQQGLQRSLDFTWEHFRLGALKGQILDSDGSTVLVDLFDVFDVVQQTAVPLDIANSTGGALRNKIEDIWRDMEDELGGIPFTRIHALCGTAFYKDLAANAEIRETHLSFEDARLLRERVARRMLEYPSGVTWEEYRGSGNVSIPTDDAIMFPVGAPDNFVARYSPADWFDTVNTIGLPRYSRLLPPDSNADRQRNLEVQSNPIFMCTRPRTLFTAQRGA